MLVVACVLPVRAAIAGKPEEKPDFNQVIHAVEAYFASQTDYQTADLIHRSQIEVVLKSVASAGWKLNNENEIVALGLPDNSFLVRELATPAGKKFMRKVSGLPGVYSHLDRLSTIPRGQSIVRDLIRKPGGDQMIAYMATTKGGRSLGKMMGGVRGGVDLNKPTGRIYTANDLLAVLQQLHQQSAR
jgi:hypothetical protein